MCEHKQRPWEFAYGFQIEQHIVGKNLEPHRSILVEGLPGSGKSILAHKLSLHIANNNSKSEWYYEGQSDHPVRLCSIGEYPTQVQVDSLRNRWQEFVNEIEQEPIVTILDAVFLQCTLLPLLLTNVSLSEIISLLTEILQTQKSLRPLLIQLVHRAPITLQKTVISERGEWFDILLSDYVENSKYSRNRSFDGSELSPWLQFCEEYSGMLNEVVSELQVPKLIVDVTHTNSGDTLNKVMEYLGLEYIDNEYKINHSEYVGQYLSAYVKEQKLVIQSESGSLYAYGLIAWGGVQLVPKTADTFYVLGWPFKMRFSSHRDTVQVYDAKTARFDFNHIYYRTH